MHGKAAVPSISELRRLLTVVRAGKQGLRDAAIVNVSYRLGFRAKEMAGLRVSDVMNDQLQLRDECRLSGKVTKGGKPRVAYLSNSHLRSALLDYLRWRQAREGILFNRDAALFKSQKGSGFSPNTMQQLLARLHDAAGIQGGRSHSGRRWFATELISKGIDLKSVSVLMGHSSVSMTAQYAEDNPQRLRKIAADL
ncbi:site-specific integrase [Paraburkholderia sp. Ac-20342]|uniref:tyrosine-type recombinase/integrase n=1 Tax=Paraburkholderia sp. Ac-20342 TaxID=2703889 RepID=UPI00197DFAD3|nr:site-specific integrase [Paraburkholderia sp. Ac-20342]MBN3851666.1 site-specific integrase [Paraburkholderia sp. Ac-20342]